ncbi:DUF6163 family protein [Blastochloris viridis]|uniref:Permease of the major facilitator superfamily n=1 Tax=Blastochloris viridis TaxID=1079 RepID=A0A0H5BNR3_BLAVI|nr:DUF6163 family protein [Blastochloris viridis]ALK08620.1 hypothetical protein BVIR_827 [Blastochloris viridis]BAR98088.1 permease of the major facilitator superfamily [Blastochloris viridis]CUU41283.1 hypothetical protein BVIRIDIS_02720 [Blastochloris viridis]
MSDIPIHDPPIQIDKLEEKGVWARRLTLFVRAVAVLVLLKGLFHWSLLCGVGDGSGTRFEIMSPAWQIATIFFAVIDVVAGVGLWLLAAWGAAVWLIGGLTQVVIDIWFPDVYGGVVPLTVFYVLLLGSYVVLRVQALREKPDR